MVRRLRTRFPALTDRVKQFQVARRLQIVPRDDMRVLGSDYGSVVVPVSLLSDRSICYSGGVGEDISFDLALIDQVGCTVHAFDPTPRSQTYVEAHAVHEPRFVFHPYGIWSEDTTLRFFAPRDTTHVSHSALNLQGTTEYFDAPVKRIPSIMRELGHAHLDLLKLDIEGAEYEVVRDLLLGQSVEVTVLCVEFHERVQIETTLASIESLVAAGYSVAHLHGWNVTFVQERRPTMAHLPNDDSVRLSGPASPQVTQL